MNSEVKRIIRTPRDFEDYTLGRVVSVICEFDGIISEQLKNDLSSLNGKRKQFVHHLFSIKTDAKQIIEDAKNGFKLADKIISEIKKIDEELTLKYKNDKK